MHRKTFFHQNFATVCRPRPAHVHTDICVQGGTVLKGLLSELKGLIVKPLCETKFELSGTRPVWSQHNCTKEHFPPSDFVEQVGAHMYSHTATRY